MKRLIIYWILILGFASQQVWAEQRLRLATTTSTDNSGLLGVLHPVFEKEHGVKIDVIAVGTGKALKLGENGDVDVVLVHDPASEEKFVKDEFGVERLPVMHNDFVILGPPNDPAKVKNTADLKSAMQAIAASGSGFISRGDESGTHVKEKLLWQTAGIEPAGEWYLSTGQGMGAVLTIADDKQGYTLSDRGTYLAFKDKTDLIIVYQNDPLLFNPYHVIMVNPQLHPHVQKDLAQSYIDFIRGKEGQDIIKNFTVNGEVLFYPDVIP